MEEEWRKRNVGGPNENVGGGGGKWWERRGEVLEIWKSFSL